jgi:superfamily II DNA or RNA helicase
MERLKSYQSKKQRGLTSEMSFKDYPVVIERVANVLSVSSEGGTALNPELVKYLVNGLQYSHVEQLHGKSRKNPFTGQRLYFQTKEYKLFRIEGGRLILLAGYMARLLRRLKAAGCAISFIDRSPERKRPDCYTPRWDKIPDSFSFRPRQEELLQLLTRVPCGIIKAVTGFGKTTCIGAASQLFPDARIDVVTKSVDVAERIVKSLRRFIPKVGLIGDGHRRRERVTVITAGSLQHADGDADFLFADEVHQLATVNFSTALAARYRNSRNFGLSATPYARMDNAHAVLEPLFGPMIFDLPYQQAVELGLVVPVRVTWLPIRLTHNPAERHKHRVMRKKFGIWTNHGRNAIIADAVRAYPSDCQILILVETIEHAVHLGSLLPDFTLMYASMKQSACAKYKRAGLLPADYERLSFVDKHDLRAQFEAGDLKRVIATDVWSTGVDFEQLNVLVRADDRDSDIVDVQGPGRVSRTYTAPDGTQKEFGEVIDCMDTFDTTFYRKSTGRRDSYKLLGWEQNWNDAARSWRNAAN